MTRSFKARLVARGFTHREGVDFNEIFSHVVKHNSITIFLAMTTLLDMELEQMDVKTAFLNGKIEEQILMTQPKGFAEKWKENYVFCYKNHYMDSSNLLDSGIRDLMSLW